MAHVEFDALVQFAAGGPHGIPNLGQYVILGFTVDDFEKRMSVLAQNVFGRQVSLDDMRKEVPSVRALKSTQSGTSTCRLLLVNREGKLPYALHPHLPPEIGM